MTFDVEFQVNPMTLDVDMGTVYDVTGDEYERGYSAGEQAGYATGKQEGYSEGEAAGEAVTGSVISRSISGQIENEYAKKIASYTFQNCGGLTSVSFPNATSVDAYSFQNCTKLASADLPLVTSVGLAGFSACKSLASVNIPQVTSIGNSALYQTKINRLVLRKTDKVCGLVHTNALGNTPIANGTGYIYVPDDLVDSYKAATNWSTYAAQIKPLSELEG